MEEDRFLIVSCAILYENDKILAAMRSARKALPHKWEFPGGKVEPNESPEQAIVRELREELGIDVRILDRLPDVEHTDDSSAIHLIPFLCIIEGTAQPIALEHQKLAWIDPQEASDLDWAPADLPLVRDLESIHLRAAYLCRQLHSHEARPYVHPMANHYGYQSQLKAIWTKAVDLYEAGNRDSSTYFNGEESDFLGSIGHTAQEVYDFAEDWVKSGEPDLETFLLIAAQRRDFFLQEMKGQNSTTVVDTPDLPPKTDSVRGIEWLPRIIPKARAKLRGEMSDDLMYCCGGDRRFFKQHQIHPAEFLSFVRTHFNDDEAIIDFVVGRSKLA